MPDAGMWVDERGKGAGQERLSVRSLSVRELLQSMRLVEDALRVTAVLFFMVVVRFGMFMANSNRFCLLKQLFADILLVHPFNMSFWTWLYHVSSVNFGQST